MNMPGVGRCGVVGTEKFIMCGGDVVNGRGGRNASELQVVVGDTRRRSGVDMNRAQMLEAFRVKKRKSKARHVSSRMGCWLAIVGGQYARVGS